MPGRRQESRNGRRRHTLPPQSSLGTLDDLTRIGIINKSPMGEKYDNAMTGNPLMNSCRKSLAGSGKNPEGTGSSHETKESKRSPGRPKTSFVEKAANSVVTAIGRELGRSLVRGLLGS